MITQQQIKEVRILDFKEAIESFKKQDQDGINFKEISACENILCILEDDEPKKTKILKEKNSKKHRKLKPLKEKSKKEKRKKRTLKWTPEIIDFLKENINHKTNDELVDLVNRKFGLKTNKLCLCFQLNYNKLKRKQYSLTNQRIKKDYSEELPLDDLELEDDE